MSTIRSLGVVLVVFAAQSATCAEIEEISVSKSGQTFNAKIQFLIEAPYETVLAAFTDFDSLAALNPAVVASSSETLPNGDTRVRTRIRDCVALFCRSVAVVEDVRFNGEDQVFAEVVPEFSDFKGGHSRWRFRDLGDRTRVHYSSHMTPDFWMPPLLSSSAVRGALRRQIEATANHLENRESHRDDGG